ncbi:MAG TPA: hypothetical protein VE131_02365 [Terriglobales bacterium]|nr:hypothetical protein [Terriglobales bacterium]
MIVRGDNVLKGLTPAETAGKAERNPVGRALGWSLIVPIISIPIAVTASAIHTSKVNEQIVHDFAAKSFADGEILPNKERSGFVFFELGDGSVNLAKLTLEVEARNVATGKLVKIVSPLPERVIKAKVSEGSEDGAEKTRNDDD